jgi:hypothetical protein
MYEATWRRLLRPQSWRASWDAQGISTEKEWTIIVKQQRELKEIEIMKETSIGEFGPAP